MRSLLVFVLIGTAFARIAIIKDAIGDLSIRMLKKTANNDENTVFSTYSISTALGMCLLGSRGETFQNMQKALGLENANVSDIQNGFGDIITEMKPFAQIEGARYGFILSSANRLYISDAFPINANYLQTVKNVFHANAASADFVNNGPGVQEEINSFVSNQTRNLIPNILNAPLSSDTQMALVNALYFKGLWSEKMTNRPSKKRFAAYPNGADQTVDWIGLSESMAYASTKEMNVEFVEVPYNGRYNSSVQTSMLFILPEKAFASRLKEWTESDKFTWKNIFATIKSMKSVTVNLTLPKFKVESTLSLKEQLISLGMAVPFLPGANFSGMTDSPAANLILSDVQHSAKIEVDEYGTEAAAATVVKAMFASLTFPPPPEVNITLDRPFISMILLRQGESIVPLFTSVINKI